MHGADPSTDLTQVTLLRAFLVMMKTYRRLRRISPLICSLLIQVSVVRAGDQRPLETVSHVDPDRYMGTWYEIARLPNWFQKQCIGNVTANYQRFDDGNIEVVNSCLEESGRMDQAHGVARIVDSTTNAKLEVSFVSLFGWNLFWGDYWILGLGDDYEYAVVGMPSRRYAWILSRTVQLSPEAWNHIQQVLIGSGYDPEKLVKTVHQPSD